MALASKRAQSKPLRMQRGVPNNDISNVPSTMDFTVGSGKKATYHKKDMIFLSSTFKVPQSDLTN